MSKVTHEIDFLACARSPVQLNERYDRANRKRRPEKRSRGTAPTLLRNFEHGLVSKRILRDCFRRRWKTCRLRSNDRRVSRLQPGHGKRLVDPDAGLQLPWLEGWGLLVPVRGPLARGLGGGRRPTGQVGRLRAIRS